MARTIYNDPDLGELTRDRLTADVQLWQRRRGHRFSIDDTMTARVAVEACAVPPHRVLDLGCGLGSVLLHLAWNFPEASLVGVEAQEISFQLLRRNVDGNALQERVAIVHDDLRAFAQGSVERFDLVTGTPPYFPEGTALSAKDGQRTRARLETRGGIEDYVIAAATLCDAKGQIVLCCDTGARPRLLLESARQDLILTREIAVIPKQGKLPLFSIWVLRPVHGSAHKRACAPKPSIESWTVRDAGGNTTDLVTEMKRFSGL
jgi:tRNA1Val (adenine37-N6)-methyltransferase